ncbi:unnamed protein product [Dovyalis caffra]|uniref:Uncharacterized protein n=1 Tax=Dovyalis caffra TaxID=77055 RepID=A0AAV1RQ24_9ROSI|nr:unnamed protein product [Dovyalis caffra]
MFGCDCRFDVWETVGGKAQAKFGKTTKLSIGGILILGLGKPGMLGLDRKIEQFLASNLRLGRGKAGRSMCLGLVGLSGVKNVCYVGREDDVLGTESEARVDMTSMVIRVEQSTNGFTRKLSRATTKRWSRSAKRGAVGVLITLVAIC